jgi:hypothetical protein
MAGRSPITECGGGGNLLITKIKSQITWTRPRPIKSQKSQNKKWLSKLSLSTVYYNADPTTSASKAAVFNSRKSPPLPGVFAPTAALF